MMRVRGDIGRENPALTLQIFQIWLHYLTLRLLKGSSILELIPYYIVCIHSHTVGGGCDEKMLRDLAKQSKAVLPAVQRAYFVSKSYQYIIICRYSVDADIFLSCDAF